MKRYFLLYILLVLCIDVSKSAAENPFPNDSIPSYWMSEIVVIGERIPLIQTTSLYQVTRSEIEQLDARNPAQALQYAPGVHGYLNSRNEITFNLRGFEQRQINVFLDGVPISLPFDGLVDLSQLTGDQLKGIRINRGSTSTLYGTNTLGGGINLINWSVQQEPQLYLRLEGSSHFNILGSASYRNRFGAMGFAIEGNYTNGYGFELPGFFTSGVNEDGGRRNNSAFEKVNAGLRLEYEFSAAHRMAFNIRWINNHYQIPPNTKTERVRYWRFPDWHKRMYNLSTRHVISHNAVVRAIIFYDSNYNLLKSYDDDTYTSQSRGYAWDSIYDDYSLGVSIYPSLKLISEGSTNLLLMYKKDVHRENFRYTGFNSYELGTFSTGLEQDFQLSEQHAFSAGMDINRLQPLYANGQPLRSPIWMVNGQTTYQLTMYDELKLHMSIARKGRYPTLKELYSDYLTRNIPNPNLKSEYAVNSEVGIKYSMESGYLQAIAYYNSLKNLITTRQITDSTAQLQNVSNAFLAGLELDANVNFGPVSSFLNYTYLLARNTSDQRQSNYLAYRPTHQINMRMIWQITESLNTAGEFKLVAQQYFEIPEYPGQWNRFNDYTLVNLRMSYQLHSMIEFYLRVRNLADVLYENDYGVPMPGREFLAGFRFTY
jgi:iron complex outermembrane receptor protein